MFNIIDKSENLVYYIKHKGRKYEQKISIGYAGYTKDIR